MEDECLGSGMGEMALDDRGGEEHWRVRGERGKAYRFDGGQVPGRLWLVVALESEVIVETIKGVGVEGGEILWVGRLEGELAVGGDEQSGIGGVGSHMTEAVVESAEGHCFGQVFSGWPMTNG